MADLRELSARLDRITVNLRRGVEGSVAEIASAIAEELVGDTPVDTGFARANWRPSLNAPTESTVAFLDPTGAATISRIKAVARRYRTGDTMYIVNRVPYIGNLIEGSSPQAPPNFHEIAVRRGFDRARNEISVRGLRL